MLKLSIIVPAFNEAPTLRQLVEKILAVPFQVEYEVLIVDDCSHDQTCEIANALGRDFKNRVRVFRTETNQGKGFCIKKGFEHASGDYAIVQDADFEYNPQDIPLLLAPVLKGTAEVVFGSRFLKTKHPKGMAYPNWAANRLLTLITNLLYGVGLTDVYSCYKLIPLAWLKTFNLRRRGFESEAEILAKVLMRTRQISEVAVSYQGRTVKQGKKIKFGDFFLAIQVLLARHG